MWSVKEHNNALNDIFYTFKVIGVAQVINKVGHDGQMQLFSADDEKVRYFSMF